MKNNKLIAEFMGWQCVLNDGDIVIYKHPNGDMKDVHGLLYHSSWDWLMPVVKKIKSLNPPERLGLEQRLNTYLYDIGSIYKGVVEFIKWYNTQK